MSKQEYLELLEALFALVSTVEELSAVIQKNRAVLEAMAGDDDIEKVLVRQLGVLTDIERRFRREH